MKKQILFLLLLIVVVYVGYWALNKRFLHEEIMAMFAGQGQAPSVQFEAPVIPDVVEQPIAQTDEAPILEDATSSFSSTSADFVPTGDPEIDAMMMKLQTEINTLEVQADQISLSIDELSSRAEMTNLKIQEIGDNYQLSPEQLDEILSESGAAIQQ